ncbi:MAG: insulinase family protein [Phycisphaerales bacterium]|nr:insulinase family protein [Phycisphaerales bacterium]
MPIEFNEARLANGLTIIGEIDPDAASAAAGFFIRAGTRDETPGVMGVSHFLEHMMFKGTDDLSAEEINKGFDRIGASNNAYTSHEMTVYHAHVLPEMLPTALDLLGRMMRPALRLSDFDTEKGVILEEIAMYKDNPFWVLYEEVSARHFGAHPMGYRVLGTTESIAALTSAQMRSYFGAHYAPDVMTLALAGRVDFGAAVAQAEALAGEWPAARPTRDTGRPKVSGARFEMRQGNVTRGYMLGLAEAPSVDDPRRYAATLLMQALGAADNSRLHWALIEPGIAEEAQTSFDPSEGTGQYLVFASGDPDRAGEIWGIVEREIRALRDGVNDDDLARLRAKLLTSVTLAGERPEGRMQRLGRQWTLERAYRSLDDELAAIGRVTVRDLRDLLDAFPLDGMTVGTLLPEA